MALSAAQYEERLRLLDIANGYRASAVRLEACEPSGPVSILSPTSANGTKQTSILTLNMSRGAKRTSLIRSLMSANDPKRTYQAHGSGAPKCRSRRPLDPA